MLYLISVILIPLFMLLFFGDHLLTQIGRFPVLDEAPAKSDAAVVLYTGVEYYPRLIEAAYLYNEGYVKKVVIDGDRKSNVLRMIEGDGYRPSCPWSENFITILELYGVPGSNIVAISAEDAFDTISEAQTVGEALLDRGIRSVIVTTSKFHTRRANYIWKKCFADKLSVTTRAAHSDPYAPYGWWKEGRQIRWIMAEYGAWGYYLWQALAGKNKPGSR